MRRLIPMVQMILGLTLFLLLGVFRPGNPSFPSLTGLGAGFAVLGAALIVVAPGVWVRSRRAAIASLSFLAAAALLALSFDDLLEYAVVVHRYGFPADGLSLALLWTAALLAAIDAVLLIAFLSGRRKELRPGSERWRYGILWAAAVALPAAVGYREIVLEAAALERRIAGLPLQETPRPMGLGIPLGSAVDPLQGDPDFRRYLDLAGEIGAGRVVLHVDASALAGGGEAHGAALDALRSLHLEAAARGLHPVLLDRPAGILDGRKETDWRTLRQSRVRAAALVAGALRPDAFFVLREPGRLLDAGGKLPGGSPAEELTEHVLELAAAVRAASPACWIGIALDPGTSADWKCYFDLRRASEIDLIGLDVRPANLGRALRLLEDAGLSGREVWIIAAGTSVVPAWHQPWRERWDALWLEQAARECRDAGASVFFVAHPEQLSSYRPGREYGSRRTDSRIVIESLFR